MKWKIRAIRLAAAGAVVTLAAIALTGIAAPRAEAASTPTIVDLSVPSSLIPTSGAGGNLTNAPRDPRVRVVLPAGYADNPTRKYPVVYLLHGASKDYTFYTGELGLGSLTANQPAIVVTPDAGLYGMYMNWRNGTTRWLDYHLQTVIPLVEQKFRVMPGRRWHAIAGISMGGQGTLRYASLRPDYFGTALALSPGFPNTQDPLYVSEFATATSIMGQQPMTYADVYGVVVGPYATGTNPQNLTANLANTRLYVSAGDGTQCPGDPVDNQTALALYIEAEVRGQIDPYVSAARTNGVNVTTHLTCGGHEDPVWRREFTNINASYGLFGAVTDNPTSWTYATAINRGRAWQFDYAVTTASDSVTTFVRSGRTLTGRGSGSVTLTQGSSCRITANLPFTLTLPTACS